jgi:hypothetical protein
MNFSWERNGLNVPESVKSNFACAVWDFQKAPEGVEIPERDRKILETTYYHENNFLEAVEEVFKANFWPFDRASKIKFRKLFRERKSAGRV